MWINLCARNAAGFCPLQKFHPDIRPGGTDGKFRARGCVSISGWQGFERGDDLEEAMKSECRRILLLVSLLLWGATLSLAQTPAQEHPLEGLKSQESWTV